MDDLKKQNELLRKEHREFLSLISHDLGAPLRHVVQFSALLEQKLEGQLDEDSTMYLDCVTRSAKRAQAMLDGLLTLSRLSAKAITPQKSECSIIVEETRKTISDEYSDRDIDVSADVLPSVYGDEQQLTTLFYNIIKNAVVFCEPDEPVSVTINAELVDRFWEFKVSDNGIGMHQKHQKAVFSAFRKLHTDKEYPGLGLGLALCEKIVKLHGGEISLRAGDECGTVVVFTLPAVPDS